MKYRQFFSTVAVAIGSTASCSFVLSIPATFSVEQTFAANDVAASTTESTKSIENETAVLTVVRDGNIPLPTTPVIVEPSILTTLSASSKNDGTKAEAPLLTKKEILPSSVSSVFTVPFFSQLTDITEASWKKVGCGITGLAMLIEYYHPGKVESVDTLLHEGVAAGAYDDSVGWSYNGLITVAQKYGITGSAHDYKGSTMDVAFAALKKDLQDGPIMASVHYTFKPTNPIPHLVIINGIKNDQVYYNDPADTAGGGHISIEQFKSGWKKRYIEFYPIV